MAVVVETQSLIAAATTGSAGGGLRALALLVHAAAFLAVFLLLVDVVRSVFVRLIGVALVSFESTTCQHRLCRGAGPAGQ